MEKQKKKEKIMNLSKLVANMRSKFKTEAW